MILGQVGFMTVIGGVIGIAAASVVGRFAETLLFELRGDDPLTILLAAGFLSLVIFAAGFIPAYRASNVHPMEALRYE